jgi:hypothetical protein
MLIPWKLGIGSICIPDLLRFPSLDTCRNTSQACPTFYLENRYNMIFYSDHCFLENPFSGI